MNFKNFYINGSSFTFSFYFSFEKHWNNFMYWLTKKTTIQKISNLIQIEMHKNPPRI